MPFVFKFSGSLLLLAALAGQYWQLKPVGPDFAASAAEIRAGCPTMAGPRKVETLGDKVKFYDAYATRLIGGQLGLTSGCQKAR